MCFADDTLARLIPVCLHDHGANDRFLGSVLRRSAKGVLSAPNRKKCMFRDELLLAYVGTHVVGGGVGEMWKTIRIITPRYRLWSSTT